MIKHLEEGQNFNQVIKDKTILVDFYADWCGPCQMLTPILEELNNIEIIKVNVDIHRQLATEYGVMSIPTLIFFKNGSVVRKEIGFKDKEELQNIIASFN